MSGRTRLTGREQPPLSLVQNWLKRLEASLDGSDVNHPVRISAPAAKSRQFPDAIVAFLSVCRFFASDSIVLARALTLGKREGGIPSFPRRHLVRLGLPGLGAFSIHLRVPVARHRVSFGKFVLMEYRR
jgi:hypothetical protein